MVKSSTDIAHLTYQVLGNHLRVWRLDRQSGISWDELQAVKNEAYGEDETCVEIYPKENQVVNDVNMRHLWLVDPESPILLPTLNR